MILRYMKKIMVTIVIFVFLFVQIQFVQANAPIHTHNVAPNFIVSEGTPPFNILHASVTHQSINITIQSYPGQIINLEDILVTIFMPNISESLQTNERSWLYTSFYLGDTNWDVHIQDGNIVIYANFYNLGLSLNLNDIYFIELGSFPFEDEESTTFTITNGYWFVTTLVLNEDVLPLVITGEVHDRIFNNIIHKVMYLHIGSDIFDLIFPYFTEIGYDVYTNGTNLHIINSIAILDHLRENFIVTTFLKVNNSGFNLQNYLDNYLTFSEYELNSLTVHPLYTDEESGNLFFAVTKVIDYKYISENGELYINLTLQSISSGENVADIYTYVNLYTLIDNYSASWEIRQNENFNMQFMQRNEIITNAILTSQDIANLGTLSRGSLSVPLYGGVYITSIALVYDILYLQYRYTPYANAWFTLSTNDYVNWQPILLDIMQEITDDSEMYITEIFWIYDVADIPSLMVSGQKYYFTFNELLNISYKYNVAVIDWLNILVSDEVQVYLYDSVFTLSNFNISPTIFDFNIYPWEQFLKLWQNYDVDLNDLFNITLTFKDGSEEALLTLHLWFGEGMAFGLELEDEELHDIGSIMKDVLNINVRELTAITINGEEVVINNIMSD